MHMHLYIYICETTCITQDTLSALAPLIPITPLHEKAVYASPKKPVDPETRYPGNPTYMSVGYLYNKVYNAADS